MLAPISFGINTVGVLCTYKVTLAILLEKGRNLALLLDTRKRMLDAITILLDTRKWMLDVLSNLLDSEKWMLENARNRAEI